MTEETQIRARHRPSRRAELMSAAVELLALQPRDMVTVSDIVARAGMTPAAFYYHFVSREQMIEEIVQDFADEWSGLGDRLWEQAQNVDAVVSVVIQMLAWAAREQQRATFFFLAGVGASPAVEDIRRDARNNLIGSAARAVGRIMPGRSRPGVWVRGLALVSVFEVAVRSQLSLDEAYRTLGDQSFGEMVADLSVRAAGL
jgi:AcrR family transcriptional regulator